MPIPTTFCGQPLTKWGQLLALAYITYKAGCFMDDNARDRMTRFRDKSALFKGEHKEGDPPSWGRPEYKPFF